MDPLTVVQENSRSLCVLLFVILLTSPLIKVIPLLGFLHSFYWKAFCVARKFQAI